MEHRVLVNCREITDPVKSCPVIGGLQTLNNKQVSLASPSENVNVSTDFLAMRQRNELKCK